MKILLVGANLFHADRRMDGKIDVIKLVVHFLQFCNRTQKEHGRTEVSKVADKTFGIHIHFSTLVSISNVDS